MDGQVRAHLQSRRYPLEPWIQRGSMQHAGIGRVLGGVGVAHTVLWSAGVDWSGDQLVTTSVTSCGQVVRWCGRFVRFYVTGFEGE